ncbi:MAG: hypothetical protein ACOYXT_04030 [Bacteroidota bacterium]
MITRILMVLFLSAYYTFCFSQWPSVRPHPQAHAHNDYEHERPLKEALQYGFALVEADVHLRNDKLVVAHERASKRSPQLEQLYLKPLDSLLKLNGRIYIKGDDPFYLMIDLKTEAEATYLAIKKILERYPRLLCSAQRCAVKIFLSGNRPIEELIKDGYHGIGLDGRPDDLGKGYPVEIMPVVSDNFNRWSNWNGRSDPDANDLVRVRQLAKDVHAEGKKLRLWAAPDHEKGWTALLEAGVDLISTDHLKEFHEFLVMKEAQQK